MVQVVLDNIRSVHNVGSIFRTCDAAGVQKIYLCGVTPSPRDRFGRERSDLAKVALGAQKSVAWEHADDSAEVIAPLKEDGVFVVAVEQDARAENFKKFSAPERVAFVFGEETKGLSQKTLSICDATIEIPMRGEKESLNVSVCVGVILFR